MGVTIKMSKKGKIIVGIVVLLCLVGFGVYKSDILLSEEQKSEKLKNEQLAAIAKTKFKTLPVRTMDELDKKIKSGDPVIAYFGWSTNCGDARLFEMNSFDKFLDNDKINNLIYVIDLDKEAPEALTKPELRKPITKRFLIDTWTKDKMVNPMSLKSPQIIYYKNGKIQDLVSWTTINSDAKYGMNEDTTKKFFDYVKKDQGIA